MREPFASKLNTLLGVDTTAGVVSQPCKGAMGLAKSDAGSHEFPYRLSSKPKPEPIFHRAKAKSPPVKCSALSSNHGSFAAVAVMFQDPGRLRLSVQASSDVASSFPQCRAIPALESLPVTIDTLAAANHLLHPHDLIPYVVRFRSSAGFAAD